MTATSLNLNGQPVKLFGAYVKNISSNLGLSTNPSSATITLAEDDDAIFVAPTLGTFHTITVGSFKFSGVVIRYEKDVANIGGRVIRVTMNDVREIMKSVPVIIAPGSELIVAQIEDTECSLIDAYGAYSFSGGLINLSGWNEAGMTYERILAALNGDNVRIGDYLQPVPQQTAKVFGEEYRFNLINVSDRVNSEHRINTNLVPLSNIIEDLSNKHAFDWFINSERAEDGIIDVTVKIIDRSVDSNTLELPDFLAIHQDKVISATSGVELRNEIACLALQGAPVEQLLKVEIKGLANEPIDLTPESGAPDYVMTESEMRAVLAGRETWELWVSTSTELGGGGGFSRYGESPALGIGSSNKLLDSDVIPIINPSEVVNAVSSGVNIPKNTRRILSYLNGERYGLAGKVYEKLKSHSETVYGKRWVHDAIADEIIESAWTRDVVVAGTSPNSLQNKDPNEFFRQDDGRTRAYVEYTEEDSGGAFSLGLTNLETIFGDTDLFRNVTVFGRTFQNQLAGDPLDNGTILPVALAENFNTELATIDADKSSYTYDAQEASLTIESPTESGSTTVDFRTKLFVAGTTDKDGVITVSAPVYEAVPNLYFLLNLIQAEVVKNIVGTVSDSGVVQEQLINVGTPQAPAFLVVQNVKTADDIVQEQTVRVRNVLQHYYGTSLFGFSTRCFQPKYAYIPVRSRTVRYGPVLSSELNEESAGRLEILQDDGFAPWEFGGVSLMIQAMQLKVDNASSSQKEVFSAKIDVEGYPLYNLGDSLDKNGNINSISITFGVNGGVRTSYSLQTFTRRFGEFTKEDFARLALFSTNSGARTLPQQATSFNQRHRWGVNKKSVGRGNSGSNPQGGGVVGFG